MNCTKPILLSFKDKQKYLYPQGLEVPCGKCLACRKSRARQWSLRIIHELESWDDSCFVTLTFNDEHLPSDLSVRKSHLQNFFKRLRKSLGKRKIKYYACAEYGEQGGRPHYHAIIFGLSIQEHETDRGMVVSGPVKDAWYENGTEIGMVHIGLVTPESANYVCGYINKKYYGAQKDSEYTNRGLETPFQLSSTGLGLKFAIANKKQFEENLSTSMFGIRQGLPRYYVRKLGIDTGLLSAFAKDKSLETELHYMNKGFMSFSAIETCKQLSRNQAERNIEAKERNKSMLKKKL